MPQGVAVDEIGSGLPQLPVPDFYPQGERDGRSTFRDGSFDAEDDWSTFLFEDDSYVYFETYTNEFLRERAPARDLAYRKRTVLHSTRRTREIGGGRCVTEVQVRYQDYRREAYLVAMWRQIWRTDKNLTYYFERLTNEQAAAAGLAGDALATGITTSAGAATGGGFAGGAGLGGTAATGVGVPIVLGTAVGVSAFLTATALMKWLKEDDMCELHEEGWTRLGWYHGPEEPVDPNRAGEVVWEAVGYHPCGRPITGSPSPPNMVLDPGGSFPPPAAEEPEPTPAGLPTDEDEIEFDPRDPNSEPFLDEVDRSSLQPGDRRGELVDTNRNEEGDFVRILHQVGDSWLIVVFDNRFQLVRDDLYDRETSRFVPGDGVEDRAVGEGLCQIHQQHFEETWLASGLRVEMHYRVLLVEQEILVKLAGIDDSTLSTLAAGAATGVGLAGTVASADGAQHLSDLPGVGALKAAGDVAPYASMLLNIMALTDRDEITLVDEGWAPVGYTEEPERWLGVSEYWTPVGLARPCDPRIAQGYVPDYAPPESDLDPVEVPEVERPPVDDTPPGTDDPADDRPAPWQDPPDLDRPEDEGLIVLDSGPRRRKRRRAPVIDDTHYGGPGDVAPPIEVRQGQWVIERILGQHFGQSFMGMSRLVSWRDPIGPGREAHAFEVVFPLNETTRPQRTDEFTPFPTVARLHVSVFPSEPFRPDEQGRTKRVYTAIAWISDSVNDYMAVVAEERWNDSPVTAARLAIEGVYAKPLRFTLRASEGRPFSDVPYDVKGGRDKPPMVVPSGFVPRRLHALYTAPLGVKFVVLFIALLAVGIPIGFLIRARNADPPDISALLPPSTPATPAEGNGEAEDRGRDPNSSPPVEVVGVPLGLGEKDPVLEIHIDEDGGISWSIVGTDGQRLGGSEIDEVWVMRAYLTLAYLTSVFNDSSYPCGAVTDEFRVTCPLGAGRLAEGEHLVIAVKLAGPVGEGARSFTYGLAFDDDGDESDNYHFAAPFDADFFRNSEHWYQLHVDEDGDRTMWADGARNGALGVPRFSSAAVIERGDTLIWVIPRSEVPGEPLQFRATAFHDNGEPGAVPSPATSGGDVSGLGVEEPMVLIDSELTTSFDLDEVPPDIPDPRPRVEVTADPDAHIAEVLIREFETRLNDALEKGSDDDLFATLHPFALGGPQADACRQEMASTIALADAVTFTSLPASADTSTGRAVYSSIADIHYPTGTVQWGPILLPGPQGRLFLVLPACV